MAKLPTNTTTTIKRAPRTENFVTFKTDCLRAGKLSWAAKGLHSYLMQLPDDWELNMEDLFNRSKDGRTATMTAIKELVRAGFFERKDKPRVNGRFTGIEYIVHEESRFGANDNQKTPEKTQLPESQSASRKTARLTGRRTRNKGQSLGIVQSLHKL